MDRLKSFKPKSEERLALSILKTGVVQIADVRSGERPYVYTSGQVGPLYADIKGLISRQETFNALCKNLAFRIYEADLSFDFVVGIMTGGGIPGYALRNYYQQFIKRQVPYCYLRPQIEAKKTGVRERITGLTGNEDIKESAVPLLVEELINTAGSIQIAQIILEEEKHPATHVATFFDYETRLARERLGAIGLTSISLVRLSTVLNVAEDQGFFPSHAIDDCRTFLANPNGWRDNYAIAS